MLTLCSAATVAAAAAASAATSAAPTPRDFTLPEPHCSKKGGCQATRVWCLPSASTTLPQRRQTRSSTVLTSSWPPSTIYVRRVGRDGARLGTNYGAWAELGLAPYHYHQSAVAVPNGHPHPPRSSPARAYHLPPSRNCDHLPRLFLVALPPARPPIPAELPRV